MSSPRGRTPRPGRRAGEGGAEAAPPVVDEDQRWIYRGAMSTANARTSMGGVERKLGESQMKKLLHMTWSELICNRQLITITIVYLIGNGR